MLEKVLVCQTPLVCSAGEINTLFLPQVSDDLCGSGMREQANWGAATYTSWYASIICGLFAASWLMLASICLRYTSKQCQDPMLCVILAYGLPQTSVADIIQEIDL